MEGDELPAGWTTCTLGDLIPKARPKVQPDPASDLPFIGMDHIEADGFHLTGQARFADMKSAGSYFLPKDILYGRLRPYLNKVHRAKFEGVASAEFIVLPSADHFDSDFIKYLLHRRQFVDFAMSKSSGDRPRVKFDGIAAYEFALPPLSEQQRIVEKIETLFAELDKGEEALHEVQKLLARYRQSVLKAAVTGTLTADWRAANGSPKETGEDLLARILKARRETWQGRGKYQEALEPDTDGLPELPNGWVWASMDQLLGHLTSGSRDWKQYYGEGTGTFIMAQNVRPMRFDMTERFLVNPPPGSPDAVRSQVRLDDLLITIVGANTGDVCRFPLDVDQHYVCQSVALMRLVEPDLSRFVELYLSGKGAGRDQLEKHIYGAGRPHLSFEQLRSIAVPLPPNNEREELMGIVNETLSNLDHVRSACNDEAKRSAGLRQSVLKAAFSGKLVPQDPSDEPADKLLERIRTARAEKPKGKRKKAAA